MKQLLSSLLLVLFIIPFSSDAKTLKFFCVATVQLNSTDVGNFDRMNSFAASAKNKGADLIVFPEESVLGWLNPDVFQKALPIPGRYSDLICQIAKRNKIWVSTGISSQGRRIDANYYEAYDAGILVNPDGKIVLNHRKHNVLKNAFDKCPPSYDSGCSYTPGPLTDVQVTQTPFGATALLVCADAYTYDTTTLAALKRLRPDLVIINWGIGADVKDSCGKQYYNATMYAADAARYLGTAYVVGANATGIRPYGRLRPACYCGFSGYATPSGQIGGVTNLDNPMALFYIPYPSKAKKSATQKKTTAK